ncbi:hypothetical protein [Dyella japonica]|uniref:Uncharacterized protein n=1 Tax=Dyella japonica TaxID=231455 RepID=A0ABV2JZ50_9GAMM
MAKTREQLQQLLAALDRAIPDLVKDTREDEPDPSGEVSGDFWAAFAGESDVILDDASAEDYEWVNQQIDALLAKHNIPLPPQSP